MNVNRQQSFRVVPLSADRASDVVEVLSDAFYDYPVMTFTVGNVGPAYNRLLRMMVNVFTASRFLREYPVIGVTNATSELLGVAAVNPPRQQPFPSELERLYEELGKALGPEGNARLALLSRTWKEYTVEQPHYHLGMVGVSRQHQGQGHARRLMESVHEMSRHDPESTGVSLTTEAPDNVPFYQHFGYELIGHRRLDGIETWIFFKPDQ